MIRLQKFIYRETRYRWSKQGQLTSTGCPGSRYKTSRKWSRDISPAGIIETSLEAIYINCIIKQQLFDVYCHTLFFQSNNHGPQNRTDRPSQTICSRSVQGLPRQCLARGLAADPRLQYPRL